MRPAGRPLVGPGDSDSFPRRARRRPCHRRGARRQSSGWRDCGRRSSGGRGRARQRGVRASWKPRARGAGEPEQAREPARAGGRATLRPDVPRGRRDRRPVATLALAALPGRRQAARDVRQPRRDQGRQHVRVRPRIRTHSRAAGAARRPRRTRDCARHAAGRIVHPGARIRDRGRADRRRPEAVRDFRQARSSGRAVLRGDHLPDAVARIRGPAARD